MYVWLDARGQLWPFYRKWRDDVALWTVGPYFGNWIPWNGGMRLPDRYVYTPHLPLPQSAANLPFHPAMVEAQMPTVNLKFEKESNEALRVVITDVLNNSLIYESGKVNIVFKVSEDKHIEILNVFGTNPALVSSVKYQMGRTIIMVPEALEGTYMIPVLF